MRLALAVAPFAVLALSAPAHAKEIQRAVVCGLDRCTAVAKPGVLPNGWSSAISLPPPGPYFRFELFYGGGHGSEVGFYVPRAARVATRSTHGAGYLWAAPQEMALQDFRRFTRGLRPFPRPRFHEVAIDGEVVADPRSYERLLTLGNSAPMRLAEADWQRVEFRSVRVNPWSLSKIRYSPGSDILSRNLGWVKVPPRLAAAIEARSSLEASRRGGFDWPLTAGLVVACGLAIVLFARGSRTVRTSPAERILPPGR